MPVSTPPRVTVPFYHPLQRTVAIAIVTLALTLLPPRRARAEDFADAKVMYYAEGQGRISVFSPTALIQREFESGLTIKIDGIYNSISGATPTGAPPKATVPAPVRSSSSGGGSVPTASRTDEGDDEHESDSATRHVFGSQGLARFSALSAATPTSGGGSTATAPASSGGGGSGSSTPSAATPSAPQSGKVPTADFSDERVGASITASKRWGRHTPSLTLSYSDETDYLSLGASLQDAVDFNKKNTTFIFGGAYTDDTLSPANGQPDGSKRTVDVILGATQVLTPTTLLTVNLVAGEVSGLLTDPYKVVELNGAIVPEKRPDSKSRVIGYVDLNQFITPLNGSLDLGFREYSDDFGIRAETVTLAWFQKLGPQFILSPRARYYTQTAADFYDVTFSGSPQFYSSDYRVSALTAVGYGLKAIWIPSSRCSLDLEYERYTQEGTDGITSQDAYPSADIVIAGVRIWL